VIALAAGSGGLVAEVAAGVGDGTAVVRAPPEDLRHLEVPHVADVVGAGAQAADDLRRAPHDLRRVDLADGGLGDENAGSGADARHLGQALGTRQRREPEPVVVDEVQLEAGTRSLPLQRQARALGDGKDGRGLAPRRVVSVGDGRRVAGRSRGTVQGGEARLQVEAVRGGGTVAGEETVLLPALLGVVVGAGTLRLSRTQRRYNLQIEVSQRGADWGSRQHATLTRRFLFN
jgi:hypothetical protein